MFGRENEDLKLASGLTGALTSCSNRGLALLVLQPTAFCNLDCGYCYVPDRNNPARMSLGTLRKVCTALTRSRLVAEAGGFDVLWHAGEPLVAGLPFYRDAVALFTEAFGTSRRIRQTFQTNATLITEHWCEFFHEVDAEVGISLDGPKDLHDAQRPRRGGRGSFDDVMRGVAVLRANRIRLNALCVLTPTSLRQPERIFDFFVSQKIFNVAFNIEETEGAHATSLLTIESTRQDVRRSYEEFMRRFLDRNEHYHRPLLVRELYIQSQRLIARARDRSFEVEEPENFAGRIVTVSREGEVSSWSPELASGTRCNTRFFSLGNIHSVDCIDELIEGPRARQMQAEISGGIELCRQTCKYFPVCGGGLPSNKFYENGSFIAAETLRCQLQVQALTDLLLSRSRIMGGVA